MNNTQVITRFLQGKPGQTNLREICGGIYIYKGRTLTTNGEELVNYSTTIAYKKGNNLYLNSGKYSRTTSKIQSTLWSLARQYYKEENIFYY